MFSLFGNCYGWFKTRREPNRKITLVSIGLDDAGKTTTIASIQGEPPDGITPTLGFANAELILNRCLVTIYDLGGGPTVRSIWKNYYAEIFGVIFVIDSCNKNRMMDVRDVLAEVSSHPYVTGKPLLLLANKQDRADAMDVESIKSEIQLDELAEKNNFVYHMIGCSAVKGYGKGIDQSIRQGMRWLLNTIKNDMVTLLPRVEKESAVQKVEDEKERSRKRAEAKLLREEREQREKEAGLYEEEDPENEDDDDDDVATHNPFMPIKDHIKSVESKKATVTKVPDLTPKLSKKKKKTSTNNSKIPSIAVVPASPEQVHDGEDSGMDDLARDTDNDVAAVTVHRKISKEGQDTKAGRSNGYRMTYCSDEDENHEMEVTGIHKRQLKKQQRIIDDVENEETMETKPKKKKKKKKRPKGNKTAPLQTLSDGEDNIRGVGQMASHSARSLPPLRGGGYVHSTDEFTAPSELQFQARPVLPSWINPRPNSEDQDVLM